jgi:hypothetical protein
MRIPKQPESMIGMWVYLTKPRALLFLRDGTILYAPKGMSGLITHARKGRLPRLQFPAMQEHRGLGYEVKWGHLSLNEPICKTCKQSIAPDSLIRRAK